MGGGEGRGSSGVLVFIYVLSNYIQGSDLSTDKPIKTDHT